MVELLNLHEETPTEFFIFVNQLNFLTKHNFNLIGCFTSGAFTSTEFSQDILEKYLTGRLRYLPNEAGEMEPIAFTPFAVNAINDPLEHQIENHRYKFHPLYPSRLSAIYAFGNYDDCKLVNQKYGWPLDQVRRFYLLDHPLARVIKVNMERISQARMPWSGPPVIDGQTFWEDYWQGKGNSIWTLPSEPSSQHLESGVIWEYLIEGCVMCPDHKAG